MITTFYPPYHFGGDGLFVYSLSNQLAQRGHEIEVIHCRDAYRVVSGREPREAYENHPNITVHTLKSPFGFLSPLATQQTGRPFFKSERIREVLSKGFDVIHYHNISLVGGPKILQYGAGIKLYTMHEYWLVCPTHVLFRFNRAVCEHPLCFFCTLSYKRPPQWWRYAGSLQQAVEHVDAFIAPSHFCIEMHRKMGFAGHMVRLANFVTAEGAAEEEGAGPDLRGSATAPYFLFVGRLEKLKGLQTLIPVFRKFRRARLVIAGTGSYEARLRALAGGDDQVQFMGYLSSRELRMLYRGAVALLVPTLSFESFGLVLIEAFRDRTPVIARNLGGMTEIVTESRGGRLYRTEPELLAYLQELLDRPETRRELGMKGYDYLTKHWTADVHIRSYFELIREIGKRTHSKASSQENSKVAQSHRS